MNILGVSFDYHEASAALVQDGKVTAAAAEERFTRIKNDASLPINAIKACCKLGNIEISDIDIVVYYEIPVLKFDRILRSCFSGWKFHSKYFWSTVENWLSQDKFYPKHQLSESLAIPISKIKMIRHHQSHAASAFYASSFDKATVVTLDGVGEHETASISLADGNKIKTLRTNLHPHSIGLFYSAITAFLGFKVNEDEYKVMGMSGYGQPQYYDELRSLFTFNDDGTFTVDQRYFDFHRPVDLPYTTAFTDLLGEPRVPESSFVSNAASHQLDEQGQHYANIAASAQRVTEEVIAHVVFSAIKQTKVSDVCLAGGVALNSLANGKLQRKIPGRLYVQPAAGDSGTAIGAALHWHFEKLNNTQRFPMDSALLGPKYDESQIQKALQDSYTEEYEYLGDEEKLCTKVADLLNKGAVVGWFQGRSEFGPRALGSRSILANPLILDMQDIVNKRIKFREAFRPFAPAVPAEDAEGIFDISSPQSDMEPEHFMLSICQVKEAYQKKLPSITHVDGTARVQLVSKSTNALFHNLLKKFGEIAELPVLLNTSFNLRGEPIVETPLNAIRTFEWSGMDYLVLGRYLIKKS